jgi:hypothetical protein
LRCADRVGLTGEFYKIVESNFSPFDSCVSVIGAAFRAMVFNESFAHVAKTFNVCPGHGSGGSDGGSGDVKASGMSAIVGFLQDQFAELSEFNYPYPVDFAGHTLPANPPKVACGHVEALATAGVAGSALLHGALHWYYNASGVFSLQYPSFLLSSVVFGWCLP